MQKSKEIAKAEIQVCLNCPYKKCIDSWGKGCKHLKAEMEKIKENYRKDKKKNESIKRNLKPTTQAV